MLSLNEIRRKFDEIFGEFSLELHNLDYKNVDILKESDFLIKVKNLSIPYFVKIISIFESIPQEERADIFVKEFKDRANLAIPENFPCLLVIFVPPKKMAKIRFGWISRVGKLVAVKANVLIAIDDGKCDKDGKIDFEFLPKAKN